MKKNITAVRFCFAGDETEGAAGATEQNPQVPAATIEK